MTRSIVLSNTQYSVLLEAEGKYITIGSEWIGSLVKYEEESICYSKLFASDDPYYTDQNGVINDECEYFGHGIVNNEKIFIQNYVYDVLFEIEFNFGKDEKYFFDRKDRFLFFDPMKRSNRARVRLTEIERYNARHKQSLFWLPRRCISCFCQECHLPATLFSS